MWLEKFSSSEIFTSELQMPKLLSVNIGLPREVAWQGRIIRTGIGKSPVSHRVVARRLNLDGDGQGDLDGHGGEQRAVMVYQIESYRYWERILGRTDFEFGQFGENLTVEGLPDNQVCIGDRYRIGSAVFEVTQPRVTCYRLGIRMSNPQMASLLVSHRRPGFYCRVITEGDVGSGDDIQKIADGPENMTVAEIDSLLYLPNHDLKSLARATRIPALSLGWRNSFESLIRADEDGIHEGNPGLTPSMASALAWDGFRPVVVIQRHQETVEVVSLVLADPKGPPLPPAQPGQYIVLRYLADKSSPPLIRSYSISGGSGSGTYRISVKRGTGPGSQYLADRAQIGDTIEICAPRGDFILRSNPQPVVLLSAGIGVTPVLSMLHALATRTTEPPRTVWWIHAARNSKEHVFAEEARHLLATIPGSHSMVAYSNPDPADRLGADFDIRGHWDLAALKQLALPPESEFYLCGPSSFLQDMYRDLTLLGVPHKSIHQEVFGAIGRIEPGVVRTERKAPHPPSSLEKGHPVSFTRSGLTVPWDDRFESILEFAEACDVPVRWSCRTGVCHTCECGVLSGRLRYTTEPLDPPAHGNALICCAIPESAIEVDL